MRDGRYQPSRSTPSEAVKRDGLVVGARRAADGAVQRVDVDDAHADRAEDAHHGDERGGHHRDADRPALRGRGGALAAMAERDPGREADEHDAGGQRERAGHVVGGRALLEHVVDVAAAVDGGEHAERERDRGAHAGPQPREPNAAATVAITAIAAASACWVRGTPGPGSRKASSSAWASASTAAPLKTTASAERLRIGWWARREACPSATPRPGRRLASPGAFPSPAAVRLPVGDGRIVSEDTPPARRRRR